MTVVGCGAPAAGRSVVAMDHARFARTVVVCSAAGAVASFGVFEAAPILCLAFLTVAEGREGRFWLGTGTTLLGAWLFIGGPLLLASMGIAFALSAATAQSAAPDSTAAASVLAASLSAALAAALAAGVTLAVPCAAALATSLPRAAAGALYGLWLGLSTLPLHVAFNRPTPASPSR